MQIRAADQRAVGLFGLARNMEPRARRDRLQHRAEVMREIVPGTSTPVAPTACVASGYTANACYEKIALSPVQ